MKFNSVEKRIMDEVADRYIKIINRKKKYIFFKRVIDLVVSIFLIIVLLIPMLIIALLIYKEDKKNPLYFQERVTKNGRIFKIIKFRSMKVNESNKQLVTVKNDDRITNVGHTLRKYRLDELPQLFNILVGDMTLVGTRPEVPKYVEKYTADMLATLLLPAGVTSLASIMYKDEADLLESGEDNPDDIYINVILKEKMKYNLDYIENFSFLEDLRIILLTVKEVFF